MHPYKFALFPVVLLLGSLFLIGVGCGGKTIQYPEDHERYLRIDRAVESLRQAYVRKDSSDLASLMADQGYQVDQAQADAYTLNAALRTRSSRPPVALPTDVLRLPMRGFGTHK